ncbi:hypothetical protein Mapa_009059 [Marchantia paleacea]|nr:hypothetical protein Mapa_009059 [Marchantia paleacea]
MKKSVNRSGSAAWIWLIIPRLRRRRGRVTRAPVRSMMSKHWYAQNVCCGVRLVDLLLVRVVWFSSGESPAVYICSKGHKVQRVAAAW